MADTFNWSTNQRQIIDQRKGNLLVSAAAGSGKTAVLVERILHIVTENEDTDLTQLLIVTFTRMAANQMKEKIMKRLLEMAEADPDNVRLQYLITQVPESRIMTIDAFCLSVLKRFITRIPELDPSFRSADEQELEMLGLDVLSDTLSDAYDEWERHPDSSFSVCFDAMLQQFAGTRQDSQMEPLLYSIYKFSAGFPDPFAWLHQAVEDHRSYPVYPAMQGLEEILKRFHRDFRDERSRRNVVGFADVESAAARILMDEEGNPSPEAISLSEEIDYIFIDEYQDSNDLQERILQSIARTNDKGEICNIFMVGDVKQSIYGFRGTSSELFETKMKDYVPYEEGKNSKIFLQTNYRSRPEVLDGINYFFESLMTLENTGIDYRDGQSLNPGRPKVEVPADVESFEPQLVVLNKKMARKDQSDLEMEAQWVADEIAYMLENAARFGVTEKDGSYRPIQARDIVILLRSPGKEAQVFMEALEEKKIPCSASLSVSFLESQEIKLALSLLRCIDNIQQDIPLFALLHSPIGDLSSQELAFLRIQCGREMRFHEAAMSYAREYPDTELGRKLNRFFSSMERWRNMSRIFPLEELLNILYEESGLNQLIFTLSNPQQRRANLAQLLSQAKTFEEGIYTGVFQFLRFMDRMKERKKDYEQAQLPSDPNAVQILSIHKSKGLEYPVVFVSRLGKQFNVSDASRDPLLHSKAGIGFQFVDADYPVKLDNPHRTYVAQQIVQDLYKEELRVLYVAMTRAKERLILTGAMKDETVQELSSVIFDREEPELGENADFLVPSGDFFGVKTFLGWLTAVMAGKSGQRVRIRFEESEEMALQEETEAGEPATSPEDLSEIESQTPEQEIAPFAQMSLWDDEEMDRFLLWEYPHLRRNSLPVILSVSSLKASAKEEVEKKVDWKEILNRPVVEDENVVFTGTYGGTLFHEVLARCDLNQIQTAEGREKLLQEMVEKHVLTEEESAEFPMDWLEAFAESEVCARMRQAKVLLREESFLAGFPAKELWSLVPEYFDSEPEIQQMEEEILIQGIIDTAYLEEDGWEIVDYKTDQNLDQQHLEMYSVQLQLYARALERAKNTRVKGLTLYDVRRHQAIRVERMEGKSAGAGYV